MGDIQASLQQLTAYGLILPSPAYLFGALLFGLIGLIGWRHGRRQRNARPTWLGLSLMLYPYLVTHTGMLYLLGGVLVTLLYFSW